MVARIRLLVTIAFGLAVLAACGTPQVPPVNYELDVTLTGTGTGTITSSPAGIDTAVAGGDAAEFEAGTVVTLTATAGAGSTFTGWGGACSGTAETCAVTMSSARSVTATFTAELGNATVTVAVLAGGDAVGTVTSDPAGLDADTLSAEFAIGSTVVLTATVTEGGFYGWSGGACNGIRTATCSVTVIDGLPTFTAMFNDIATLDLQVAANSDDSEEFLADSFDARNTDGRWNEGFSRASSSDLELAYDPDHAPQIVGMRFQNVTLPAGATVVTAELGFTAFANPGTGTTGTVALTIAGQAADAPASFVTDPNNDSPRSFDISERPQTSASVEWTITDTWVPEQAYGSSNAASVLQEIVDRSGWTSGSPVVFVLTGDPDSVEYRRAYAHDADPTKAPTLTVQYVTMPVAP